MVVVEHEVIYYLNVIEHEGIAKFRFSTIKKSLEVQRQGLFLHQVSKVTFRECHVQGPQLYQNEIKPSQNESIFCFLQFSRKNILQLIT
jgi:hypothetical protein